MVKNQSYPPKLNVFFGIFRCNMDHWTTKR
ncbi:pKP93L [African swine fever virus]|uniref:PKP93L n=1 Tax=African swine fever virus TaxID=10497 RepID=A0A3G1EUS5_ASF|nr:pKP93L [African swine fever virus]AOO54307.1 pKP93L [African swine fever virus]QPL11695.1 pKP93L [African swine fever virus]QPL11912.1 pKP93L [African swine fever virus]UCX48223.1 pKP93L [African swine fever virus]UCX48449.1 pKP93L [African swine fever virus]